jgi:Ca2+:H+ antiporter
MILFVSVLLVNYLIQDGKSNYLEGNLLLALYLIVAYVIRCLGVRMGLMERNRLASWFYPADGSLAQAVENN